MRISDWSSDVCSSDLADHRQVVGDEDERQLELLLEVLQQVDDLRLDRDVERRDRLVADHHLGAAGKGAGDADALALPAGDPEERRGGKECGSTGRARWSPD